MRASYAPASPSTRSPPMPEPAPTLTLAVPCRTDEPALARTLEAARAALEAAGQGGVVEGGVVELLVCINGPAPAASTALRDVEGFARAVQAPFAAVAADGARAASLPVATAPLTVAALLVGRAGKPLAWNVLRQHARAPVAIFFDADVRFARDAFRRLLGALADAPGAALASGKTTCAPRPRAFERIMAAPYGVDFPNLSAQLYAGRLVALPARRDGGHLASGGDDQAVGRGVKVLFLVTRLPVPPWRGDQVRAYHHLRLLARAHEITCCALLTRPPPARLRAEVAALGVRLVVVPLGMLGAVPALARALLGDRRPFQVLLYARRRAAATVARLGARAGFDVVHAQLVRAASYLPSEGGPPAVVDLIDALSANFARRASSERGPLGTVAAWEAARLARYGPQRVARP